MSIPSTEEVIKHIKTQWKVFRDEYIILLEGTMPIKRDIPENEKDVAFSVYLKQMGSSVVTEDEAIRAALEENARLRKLPGGKRNREVKERRKQNDDLMERGVSL